MNSARRSRLVSRGLVTFALAVAGVASIAARPAAPGVTYRMRLVMTPPDIPGMPPQPQTVIVGHGAALGSQSRLDIDTVSGTNMPLTVGDYMLSLDSGRMVMVSPTTKTWSDGPPGMGALPPDMLAAAQLTSVNVTTEKLGAGEVMQGFVTEKYRITTTYILTLMGTSLNTMTTSELWVAQLPGMVTTPFDGTVPKSMSEGPMKELAEKMGAARKALGTGTSLKTITTASITGPMNITTVNTVELLDVKATDVDPGMLKVPEGFTKRP